MILEDTALIYVVFELKILISIGGSLIGLISRTEHGGACLESLDDNFVHATHNWP